MDICLNTRAVDVLIRLLEEPGPVAVRRIAADIGCTPRMVRYSLEDVQLWLKARRVSLKRGKKGVSIEASEDTRQRLIAELKTQKPSRVKFSKEKRHDILCILLLSTKTHKTMEEIADFIGVSRNTIQKDLNIVREILQKKYGLILETTPGKGVMLTGSEADFRQAIVDIMMDSVTDDILIRYFGRSDTTFCKPYLNAKSHTDLCVDIWASVLEATGSDNLGFLKDEISYAESCLQISFSDTARVGLLVHLAIAIGRLREGNDIVMAPEQLEALKVLPEFGVARTMAEHLSSRFGIVMPEAEVGYITLHLIGAKRGMGREEVITKISGVPVLDVVREMIREAEKFLHKEMYDRELEIGLATHLIPAYYRLRYALPIRNPLLHEIKKTYPLIYLGAQRAAAAFQKMVGLELPEEEVAYVAMHLGAALERAERTKRKHPRVAVLCASGIGTAAMLASRLKAEFAEIDVVGTYSVLDVWQNNLSGADAVVSTVPVSFPGVPCVVVKPMLLKEDAEKVRDMLETVVAGAGDQRSHTQGSRSEELQPFLLDSKAIRFNVPANNWVEAVETAGEILTKLGVCEPRYVKAMVKQIQTFGGYVVLGKGVALAHASPTEGVLYNGLSLVHLKHPVIFPRREDQPVRIVFALASTTKVTPENLRRLNALLMSEDLEKLINSENLSDFVFRLRKMMFLAEPVSDLGDSAGTAIETQP